MVSRRASEFGLATLSILLFRTNGVRPARWNQDGNTEKRVSALTKQLTCEHKKRTVRCLIHCRRRMKVPPFCWGKTDTRPATGRRRLSVFGVHRRCLLHDRRQFYLYSDVCLYASLLTCTDHTPTPLPQPTMIGVAPAARRAGAGAGAAARARGGAGAAGVVRPAGRVGEGHGRQQRAVLLPPRRDGGVSVAQPDAYQTGLVI